MHFGIAQEFHHVVLGKRKNNLASKELSKQNFTFCGFTF